MNIVFETRCMRCERLIKKSLPKKEGKEPTIEEANQLIMHTRQYADICPYCQKQTFQIAVTTAFRDTNITIAK